jgi:hypothetical protein
VNETQEKMEKVAKSENARSFIEMDDEEDLRDQEGEDVDAPSSHAADSQSWQRSNDLANQAYMSNDFEAAAQLACSATMMHRASHRPGWLVQKPSTQYTCSQYT